MADNRYRGSGRRDDWREREGSIFSDDDDDRWRRGSGRWTADRDDDDRGFFDRAGDEVRSWFGDEEAERRRERDMMRDDARSAFEDRDFGRGRFEGRNPYGFGGFGGEPGWAREQGAYGRRERGAFFGGRSPDDENYRRWRDQQIRQLDEEYDQYCRERQHQFAQDFDSWRSSRLTQGGPSAAGTGTDAGADSTIRQDTRSGSGAAATGGSVGAAAGETSSPSGGRGGRSRA